MGILLVLSGYMPMFRRFQHGNLTLNDLSANFLIFPPLPEIRQTLNITYVTSTVKYERPLNQDERPLARIAASNATLSCTPCKMQAAFIELHGFEAAGKMSKDA